MTCQCRPQMNSHTPSPCGLFATLLTVLMVLAATATAQNPAPFVDDPLVPDATAPGGARFTSPPAGAAVKTSAKSFNSHPSSHPGQRGKADGTSPLFLPAIAYADGDFSTSAIAMADVNGDGRLDLLIGNESSVEVMLGNGNGTFQTAQCWGVGGKTTCGKENELFINATSIAVADLNGDGKLDLAVAFQEGLDVNPVVVMLGNGDGTFQAPQVYDSGGVNPTSVAVADVNNDGRPDLVVANYCAVNDECNEKASVSVLLGNGNGTFQPAQSFSSGAYYAFSAAVADVNGDGNPDILVFNGVGDSSSGYQSNVGVLLGNGNGTFQPAVTYLAGTGGGSSSGRVVVADLKGNGKLDLVVSDSCLDSSCDQGGISVLLGNGDGTFQAAQAYGSGGYDAVALTLGDVNRDGAVDVLVGNDCAVGAGCTYGFQAISEGILGVLLGNGDGTFQPAQIYDSGGWGAGPVAAGDLTGDGELDAVIIDGCGNTCVNGVSVVGVLLSNNGESATTTTLVSSTNPVMLSQPLTYSATVTPTSGEPITGTVTFYDAWTSVAAVGLSGGQASYTTSYSTKASHPITAVYSGDANNAESSSNTLVESATNNLTKTTTVLTSSASTAAVGQQITFTATVTWAYGTVPNGELVTFDSGSTVLGTATTNGGVATLTTFLSKTGNTNIKATYTGDSSFDTSLANLTVVVDKATTATALVSSQNPSSYAQSVTFTASVTPQFSGTPTGSVEFYNGTAKLKNVTLSGGVASYTTTTLAVGTASITAEYEGSSSFDESTSAAVSQVVNQASTTTTLASSVNPSNSGQSVTFTATLVGEFGDTVKGSVTFMDGSTTLKTVDLSGGVAKYTTSKLAVGTHNITATYNGNTDFTTSSAALTQTVN